jgi:hypothetical protein
MSARKPEISRKQAWCKLAILIAESLPEPESIKFHPSGDSIYFQFTTAEALTAWAEHFGLKNYTPLLSGETWIHTASSVSMPNGWHGWYVSLTAYTPADPEPDPIDEDMSAVRAAAADSCVCCSPGDCGDRQGHVRNDRDGSDLCNCGRDWPCEKAGV